MGHSKGVLRGKFVVMCVYYIKRTERSHINDLILHLKHLEKQKSKNNSSRRREIIKIRSKINEIETKKNTNNQQNKKLVL
jgi:hypothetical protein